MGDGGVVLGIVLLVLAICIIIVVVNLKRDRHAGHTTPPAPISTPPAPISTPSRSGYVAPPVKEKPKSGVPEVMKIYSYHMETGKTICRYCGAEKDGGTNRCPVCGEKG